MNKITVMVGAGALVVGAVVALVIGFFSMPGMMMLEDESPYDFATTIERFEQEVAAGRGVEDPETHRKGPILWVALAVGKLTLIGDVLGHAGLRHLQQYEVQ